jgi:hypothetical protein
MEHRVDHIFNARILNSKINDDFKKDVNIGI